MNKKSLRDYYIQKRKQLKNLEAELKITENLVNSAPFLNSKSIFITLPVRGEIDTVPIINRALDLKKTVYLPRTYPKKHKMGLVEFKNSPDELKIGAYGIPEPIGEPVSGVLPDLTIVPALAYSIDGHRLGYGGGYYDRFLKNTNTYSIGLVYDGLLVSELPTEPTDVPVDMVITPTVVIQTNRNHSKDSF